MIGWLSIIPGAVPWGLCLLLAASVGVQTLRVSKGETALATEQRDRADERRRTAERSLAAVTAAMAKGDQRVADQQEVIRDAEKSLSQARADVAAGAATRRQLRDQVAELAAACDRRGPDSAPAGAGEATAGAGLVLRRLYEGADDSASVLAEYADAAHLAGLACERAYDTLRR